MVPPGQEPDLWQKQSDELQFGASRSREITWHWQQGRAGGCGLVKLLVRSGRRKCSHGSSRGWKYMAGWYNLFWEKHVKLYSRYPGYIWWQTRKWYTVCLFKAKNLQDCLLSPQLPMKINRCFPSCSNCLSHLLIPECSYKSYLPCWPHLSWKFFSPSMAASPVTSSTLCSRLCLPLASSRDSRQGFISIPIFLALRIWSPQGSSFPRLLGLPATSSKFQWSAKLSAKPLLWEDPSSPPPPHTPSTH